MTADEEYRRDLDVVAGRIGDLDPPDLPERFASHSGLGPASFRVVEPVQTGTIAAVDGSNAIVLDAGCVSVAVLRAAACGFSGGHQPDGGATGRRPGATLRGRQPDGGRGGQQPGREPTGRRPGGDATGRSAKDGSPSGNQGGGAPMVFPGATRKFRSVTPLRLATLGQEAKHGSFASLYRECFGTDPEATVDDDEPARTAGILRDTLEYWVALKTAERLGAGDLLALDGALRVTHASHDRVMLDLVRTCAARRVHLCAVTKRSAVTWGGGLPLVSAARSLAESHAISPP
ncbi:MAG TPA: DNA double-strand break repair nuclease NurA, partial [Methanomicrobiales archaeon]|nr:DNA double-strand break repair nuclease NurA [Methanomicrobiales archaeon]